MAAIPLHVFGDEDLRTEIGAVARTQIGKALLHGLIRRPAPFPGQLARLGNAPEPHVACADRAHLALLNQPMECLHGFFHGRIKVVPVGIVDIDIIGLETGKAFLAFPFDFVGGEAAVASGIIESQFGGDLNLVADPALLHPLADRRFALASGAAFNPA